MPQPPWRKHGPVVSSVKDFYKVYKPFKHLIPQLKFPVVTQGYEFFKMMSSENKPYSDMMTHSESYSNHSSAENIS